MVLVVARGLAVRFELFAGMLCFYGVLSCWGISMGLLVF